MLSAKSPFEMLHNHPPSLAHLKVFGCLCYATIVHPTYKFDPRAKRCIFIGYPTGQKGYKLYDLESNEVFVSRDVKFSETIFPSISANSNLGSISLHNSSDIMDNWHFTQPSFIDISLPQREPSITESPAPDIHSPEISDNLPYPNTSSTHLSHEESLEPTPDTSNTQPPIRQSNRPKQPPAWHKDYILSAQVNRSCSTSNPQPGTRFPLSHFLSYSRISSAHCAFLANITSHTEPHSYAQAILDPKWQQAMNAELEALNNNNTRSLVPLPVGHKPIGCKWVYKIKYRSDGTIERYKARLVAKGYTQVEGVDYQETFSPTTKLTTLRCLLTIAAARNWFIHQLDVQNAFLHGDLHEVVYMVPPPGLHRQGENIMFRLNKSLYGLKQASRNWFATFLETIQKAGYKQSKADYSLFTKANPDSFTAVLIYVDDILVTGNDLQEIN